MDIARDVLNDRVHEITIYIDMLDAFDKANRDGKSIVSTEQYHILMANAFVLMYNMIEATVTQCIRRLGEIISQDSECPRCLSDKIISEWIANQLGTKEQLNPESRLEKGKAFYRHVVSSAQSNLVFNKGGGGNWDDEEIFRFSERLGINLRAIPRHIATKIKKQREDDLGCMKFIVRNRNKLAHGEISFSECGRDKGIARIKEIFTDTSQYLKAMIDLFEDFATRRMFIAEEHLQHAGESIQQ